MGGNQLIRVARIAALATLFASLPIPGNHGTAMAQARAPFDTVFSQPAAGVIDALTGVLLERGALRAEQVDPTTTALLSAVNRQEQGEFRTSSVDVDRAALSGLIPANVTQFLTESGGRYVLEVRIAESASGTRVTIAPVIVITIPGTENPLGGRVVPSNGTLERQIVTALRERLAG
jgi:hypothetical protein